jgi:ABC-type nitrate/sulfonate/bicarbonate transport system permease component
VSAGGDQPPAGPKREDAAPEAQAGQPKASAPATVTPPARAATPGKPSTPKVAAKVSTPKPTTKISSDGSPLPPPAWWRSLRVDGPLPLRLGIGGASLGVLLLGWWLITRGSATEAWISPSKLPSPGAVFGALGKLIDRDLLDNVLATMARVAKGIGVAALVGVTLGVIGGTFRAIAAAVGPFVLFLRSVPMGAMLPLTVILFSIGERQKWMFIFLAVVGFVFADTVKAISSVPQRFVETAETLGASRWQVISKVLVPLALPDIVTSLRFQFGLALGYITLAEAINTDEGIGAMLNTGQNRGLIEQNYMLLIVIAGIAFLIDLTIRYLQRGFFPYRKDL